MTGDMEATMGGLINLRRARKDRLRAARRLEGDANAARHGRSKAQRAQEKSQADADARRLDGHRIERSPGFKPEE